MANPSPAGADPAIHFALAKMPYTLVAACDLAQPLAFVNIKLHNVGKTAIAGKSISASDDSGVLSGDQALAPIAPGEHVHLEIPLRHVASSAGPIGGTHVIALSLGADILGKVPVTIPQALCAAVAGPSPTANPNTEQTISLHPRVNYGALFQLARPAVPINLRGAAGGPDCAAHVGLIGALVCPDMIKSGDVLLVWDWQPPAGSAAIDGHRVYHMNGLSRLPALVATRTKDLTLLDLPKPAGGYSGQCYSVSAFAGTQESDRSAEFCAGTGSAATTTRLSASHLRWSFKSRQQTGSPFTGVFHPGEDDGFQVGFQYTADTHTFGDHSSAIYYRAALAFDLSPLRTRRLVSASLHMNIAASSGAGNNHSCATDVGTGTEFWWQNSDWIEGQFGGGVAPTDTGPVISADVTPIVAQWLRGEPNYGFVVRNSDENLDAFTDKECLTRYATDPVLEITYY